MQTKELTPKYAALAAAVEAKLGARVERLPTSTGELGYRVDAANLLEVCRALRDDARAEVRDARSTSAASTISGYGRDEWQTNSASGTGFSRGASVVPPTRERRDEDAARRP